MKQNKKPVLFLIFNRQSTTKKVFAVIRKYRPNELYIAADGPRKNTPGDEEKCVLTRQITEKIDWNCDVKRLYRNKNLGSGHAVASAIDWFFKHVNEGIILEDDCLPNTPFFVFCENMLNKYKNDKKIMNISGENFLPRNIQKRGYYFSKYTFTWGWATWKRAWKDFDLTMRSWKNVKNNKSFNKVFDSFSEKSYWHVMLELTANGKIDTWDYQWLFAMWSKGGISINPGINLVKNIGIGADATHINTNKSAILDNSVRMEGDAPLLSSEYSRKADDFASKHFYRTTLPMAVAQFLYHTIFRIR